MGMSKREGLTAAFARLAAHNNGDTNGNTSGDNSSVQHEAEIAAAAAPVANPASSNFQLPHEYPMVLPLNIGGRKFQVWRDILRSESGLFKRQLSDRFVWEPEEDGTYFMDADPDLFEHLLRFMRRPGVLPLFYSRTNGFNYDLYNRVQAEAEYFEIGALNAWIKNKKYLEAVKVQTYSPKIRSIDEIAPEIRAANQSEDWTAIEKVRKIYICPRLIVVHRGRPDMCGAACRLKQSQGPIQYEEEKYLEIMSVVRETMFDESVCRVD